MSTCVHLVRCFVAVFCAFLLVGCGTGGAAKVVRSDAPTTSEALAGKTCALPGDVAEPWVVDLPPDRRVALEAALQGSVALVAYDCKELVLLQGCGVSGEYAYAGTSLLEDTLDLADKDAVATNLSGGAALSLKLAAEMDRGMHLSIGYVVVGQRSTAVARVSRSELPVHCKAATHFVARATVGAYAIGRSSTADLASVAEMFERGARASSQSHDIRSQVAGDRRACMAATPGDGAPPAACSAPVKVMLVRIGEDDGQAARREEAEPLVPVCPVGSVRRQGVCVSVEAKGPRACRPRDEADCEEQCAGGDAESCAALGFMYETGKGAKIDHGKALEAYRRACEGGHADGCAGLGFLYGRGAGVPVDKDRARKILGPACDRGSGRACSGLGHEARLEGRVEEALSYLDRGCRLGYARSCHYAGNLVSRQQSNAARAADFQGRACQGGDPRGCLALAALASSSENPTAALKMGESALGSLLLACEESDGEACESVADAYDGRYGSAQRKPEKALQYFDKACRLGRWTSCRDAAEMLDRGEAGIHKDPAKAEAYRAEACRNGIPSACPKASR